MSGSSNSEPLRDPRAISQSFCSSFGGLHSKRNGGERVRRKITVIQDCDSDMAHMPDDAEIRALHETMHPDEDGFVSRAYEAPEAQSYSVPREHGPSSTDSSVANGADLQRIVNAPEGVLPSDLVPSPTMRGQDGSNYAAMGVVMLTLLVVDMIACARAIVGAVCTICGRGPARCQKTCRLIVNPRTRATCGRACCLPEDHCAVWNHTCTEHVQWGAKVSLPEYRTYMLFRYWQRVLAAVSQSFRLVARTLWKWTACRWAVVGLTFFLFYTAFVVPHGNPNYQPDQPELPRGEQLRLPQPPEQLAMTEDLADGYHKRVRVHLGGYVAVAMLDRGSFRNCIDEDVLKMLENKQAKGELGKKPVISPRRKCTPTNVDGAANGYMTTYKEIVEIDITFKQPGGNSATTRLVFVVIKDLRSKLLIGCPTLDALSFATSYDYVKFRAFDLTLPTMKDVGAFPDTQVREHVASLQEGIRVTPKEMKQIWANTTADPERTWTVRGAQGLPANVRVAEGPAKIRNGKVKLFVCTDSPDEDVVLDTHEVIAELCEPTPEEIKIQEDIRAWRLHSLVSNAQALGTEYISELVEEHVAMKGRGAAQVSSDAGSKAWKSPGEIPPIRVAEASLSPSSCEPTPRGPGTLSHTSAESAESVTTDRWRRRRFGQPVRRADTGDAVAVQKEMAQALRQSPEVIAKVGNSYKNASRWRLVSKCSQSCWRRYRSSGTL